MSAVPARPAVSKSGRRRTPQIGYYLHAERGRTRYRPGDGLSARDLAKLRDRWDQWEASYKANRHGDAYAKLRPDLDWSRPCWIASAPDTPPLPESAVDPYDLSGEREREARLVAEVRREEVALHAQTAVRCVAHVDRVLGLADELAGEDDPAEAMGKLKALVGEALRPLLKLADAIDESAPMVAASSIADVEAILAAWRAGDRPRANQLNAIDDHNLSSGRVERKARQARPNVSLARVAADYLIAERNRVGLKVRGVKATTYADNRRRLYYAFGLSPRADDLAEAALVNPDERARADDGLRLPEGLKLDLPIRMADATACDAFGRYWYSADAPWSRRHASNCVGAVRSLLQWASRQAQSAYAYSAPGDLDRLLPTTNPTKAKQPYQPERVRAHLAAAGEGVWRLRILLALNCGMEPADIAALKVGALVQDSAGRPALKRVRIKNARQNDDWECLHRLWPETHQALLAALKGRGDLAGDAPMLLNRNGTPFRAGAISSGYSKELAPRIANSLRIKDFRSIGSTLVHSEGGHEAAGLYLADSTALPGVLNHYVLPDVERKLSPVLDAVGDRLRADGVL